MKINLINKNNKKEINIPENSDIKTLLNQENIPLETVVIKQNDETVTEDELLSENDNIEIIKVIYGG